MNIIINGQNFSIEERGSLKDVIALFGAVPPFAAAINGGFVPRSDYLDTIIEEGDEIEIVYPVVGG